VILIGTVTSLMSRDNHVGAATQTAGGRA
jgi:hypothetical protein